MKPTAVALPSPIPSQESSQSSEVVSNHEQIERITYLASLVSRLDDVDAMLDTLRTVTATWDKTTPLKPEGVKELQELENELKNYLITKDPVRAFTAETLEQQLRTRVGGGGTSKRSYLSLLWVLGSSVLAAGSPFALPSDLLSQEVKIMLAIPLFFVVLHIGISWLFLSALKNFQQEVRKAFQLICTGVVLFGIAFSQYVAIAALQLDEHPLFRDAGFTWLVTLPFMFIFLGLRKYAQQLQIKTWLVSMGLFFVFVAILAGIALFEAYTSYIIGWFDQLVSAFIILGGRMVDLVALLGALLAWKIRKVVARSYARPMWWLFLYMFIAFLGSTLTTVLFGTGLLEGDGSGGSSDSMPFYIFMALAGAPSQMLLLWTGFLFKKELSK